MSEKAQSKMVPGWQLWSLWLSYLRSFHLRRWAATCNCTPGMYQLMSQTLIGWHVLPSFLQPSHFSLLYASILTHVWDKMIQLWHMNEVMSSHQLVELEFEFSCVLAQKISCIIYFMTTEDKLYFSCLEWSNNHHPFLPHYLLVRPFVCVFPFSLVDFPEFLIQDHVLLVEFSPDVLFL